MRKLYKIIGVFLLIIVICSPSPIIAKEYEFSGDTSDSDWETAWKNMKNQLPEELKEKIEDFHLADTEGSNTSNLSKFSFWRNTINDSIKEFLLPSVLNFSGILGIVLLLALCQQIPFGEGMTNGMMFTCKLCMTIVVSQVGYTALENAERYIQTLCSVMTTMVPVMGAVSYASGEITVAAVQNTAITLFLTVITNLNDIIVRPLLKVVLALTITSSICPEISLGNFTGNVKKIMMTIFSFILLLYSFVYGIQTSLAKATDSLGLRTVRFALSNFIPIVGGAVSDAFSALRSGMGYVRSMAGIGGISILLLMILPIAISLWMTGVMFSIANTTSELLGCSHSTKILAEMHSVLQMVSALVWMVTIFFLFSIILFTKTAGQAI